MGDCFENVRWKLRRAHQHLQAVHETAHAFLQSDFYTFRYEQDRQGRLVLKFGDVSSMPPELSVLIGDAAHQLRSALDHLLFAIAKPPPGKERDVQFPLVETRAKWAATTRMMPGVPRGVRTTIERLQPYHRRKLPQTALLWRIHEINKWDKHRALAITAASLEWSVLNVEISGSTSLVHHETFRGTLKPGTPIARLQMGHSEVGAKVQVNPKLALSPVFDSAMPQPLRNVPVISTIAGAGEFIAHTVLPMFEKFAR